MRLIIIESPYAARGGLTVAQHVHYAHLALLDSLARGEAPLASHLLYPQVLPDVGADRDLGIAAGLAWADRGDLAAFYVDLGWSMGMNHALDFYKGKGLAFEERTILERCRHCCGARRVAGAGDCGKCSGLGKVLPKDQCVGACCR